MTTIARAARHIEWNQFFLNAGDRILLDDVHMNGKVYLPGSGIVNVPFNDMLQRRLLIDEGSALTQMTDYDDIHVGVGTEWIEPMFNHLVWPAREAGVELVGAEVGVHLAENAEKILKHLPIKTLYLIDPYDENTEYQFGNPDLKVAKELARKRLEPFGDRVVWMYETSDTALPKLHNLHFVYHDSDHRRPNVERELPLGYAAVKRGGWWGGHDYKQTLEGLCEVKSCVDEFFIQNELRLLYYSSKMLNWWTIKTER